MDSSTALSGSSFTRRIWQTTVGKCFSLCRPKEDEPIAVVLLKGELMETKAALEELKSSIAAQNASMKISKLDLEKMQEKMADVVKQSYALQDKAKRQTQALQDLSEMYVNTEKHFKANIEIYEQGIMEVESKIMQTQNENQVLQNTIKEQEKKIKILRDTNMDRENRYREITEDPCTCFIPKQVGEYLHPRNEADGQDLQAVIQNLTSPSIEARHIDDIEDIFPDTHIQLTDYESPDSSGESSESSSLPDTCNLNIRYFNAHVSKAKNVTNEAAENNATSSPGQSTSTPAEEQDEEGEFLLYF